MHPHLVMRVPELAENAEATVVCVNTFVRAAVLHKNRRTGAHRKPGEKWETWSDDQQLKFSYMQTNDDAALAHTLFSTSQAMWGMWRGTTIR